MINDSRAAAGHFPQILFWMASKQTDLLLLSAVKPGM